MEMSHLSVTLGTNPSERAAVVVDRSIASSERPAGVAGSAGNAVWLADLATGAVARVVAVAAAEPGGAGDLCRRLAELGFLPGEKLRIVARGLMGREPIAVRIGTSTFALRLFEAACIRVSPEQLLQA
jgi:ferrous iron transport protein A